MSATTSSGPRAHDLIVVGSGIAGLSAALWAARRGRVLLVTKAAVEEGCTSWAQGGIAAAVGPGDSPEQHLRDTLDAGHGLCDPRAVRILVEEAPAAIERLEAWGVHFDRTSDGARSLHQEAAHRRPRVLHARGDATGREIEETLAAAVRRSGIEILEGQTAFRLLLDGDGRCGGLAVADAATGRTRTLTAGAVLLATGGAGRLFEVSTNPAVAAGDGLALAWDAGAEVASCEFVQFHPTVLTVAGTAPFLVTEALRGAGAIVTDQRGRRFLLDADSRGELAPRDVVARAIWQEMSRTGSPSVLLDCRPVGERVGDLFPSVAAACRERGLDLARAAIPIAPAAHYMIGGVRTGRDGATSVPGLYAAGEVASTGVHGANRLASNSLLEGVVFGCRAADSALRDHAEHPPARVEDVSETLATEASPSVAAGARRLRELMTAGCGIVRDAEGLSTSIAGLREIAESADASLPGTALARSATAGLLVAESALMREESRGAHLRADYPDSSELWHGVVVMHTTRGIYLDRDFAAAD